VVKALEGISFKECGVLLSFFQNGSKEFDNLKLFDLTKASPNMVENFIQGQDLNNLRWLCFQECMIQKLSTNLFNCYHLQVFHLTKCDRLQFSFDILSHGVNMSISIIMNELSTSIGKLNALLKLNLLGCSSLQELHVDMKELSTSLGKLNALLEFNLSRCSNLKELPTSLGKLNALLKLNLSGCSNLKELPTSIGQLNALQELILSMCSSL
jgi:Leucine-rich repeat (LRR) protein